MSIEYHVSKLGNDKNLGTAEYPFLTISQAAKVADEGDRVVVHEGTYRENISPERGARNELGRIVYMAAEGEHVVIKGSEVVTEWKVVENNCSIWYTTVDNVIFGGYNPYLQVIEGDWLARPKDHQKHTGTVYINGQALSEAVILEELEKKKMYWFAEVGDAFTVIYANFGDMLPEENLVEITVRKTCFYPEKLGIDYITVRGFEMAHAATPWAPPTAEQFGLIGTHWSKGWIIEDNVIHDVRCSAISIGKEVSTGENLYTRYRRKAGTYYQFEAMLAGRRMGWEKGNIGSHIIRNNVIYNCGQCGIVGHMGCAFSEIYDNHIYNVGMHDEFWGHEIAGIKLHAPIDTQIYRNHIHNTALGIWLDWQAQGTRVTANLFHHNTIDLKIEVTHGPCLVDNNIFGSAQNLQNAAQGTAYVHNMFLGGMLKYDIPERSTPYCVPHSTEINGVTQVFGDDDRFYNNIFANAAGEENKRFEPGLGMYNGCPDSLEEYLDTVWQKYGMCDISSYMLERQPVYMAHNYYGDDVMAYERDKECVTTRLATEARISKEEDGVYLEMVLDEAFGKMEPEIIDTNKLGMPRISESRYENPDGSDIRVDVDMFGRKRGEHPTVGPSEGLGTGKVKVRLL